MLFFDPTKSNWEQEKGTQGSGARPTKPSPWARFQLFCYEYIHLTWRPVPTKQAAQSVGIVEAIVQVLGGRRRRGLREREAGMLGSGWALGGYRRREWGKSGGLPLFFSCCLLVGSWGPCWRYCSWIIDRYGRILFSVE